MSFVSRLILQVERRKVDGDVMFVRITVFDLRNSGTSREDFLSRVVLCCLWVFVRSACSMK